jgi:DNA-binding HxlR family transcriptional regulator
MLGRTYDKEVCSAARALESAGERWSLLILRNAAFAGMTRFTDFQKSLDTYHLTKKGLDFKPVIIALTEWGDRWAAPDGPPIVYEHEGCGGRVGHSLYCKRCAESPRPQDVTARKTAVMEKLRRRSRS